MGKYAFAVGVVFLAAACSNVDNKLPADIPKANSKAVSKKLLVNEAKPATLKQETPESLDNIINELPAKNEKPSGDPNGDLAENPNDNDSDSDNEVPHPNGTPYPPHVPFPICPPCDGMGGLKGLGSRFHRLEIRKDKDARVTTALNWLCDHQNKDGFWSATAYDSDSTRADAKHTQNIEFVGTGQVDGDIGWKDISDIGLTGLSLLAFAGWGVDHTDGPYKKTCRNAISYLRHNQAQNGCFGSQEDDRLIYNHAICTVAIAEMFIVSELQLLKPIIDKAIDFILRCQNPGFGWRYGVQPKNNDTSISTWMVLALKCAKLAGANVDFSLSFNNAVSWYEIATVSDNNEMKTGYHTGGSENHRLREAKEYECNPTMDAMYVVGMLAMDKRARTDTDIEILASNYSIKEELPKWEHHKIDYYYWHWASLASFQTGGKNWETWEKTVDKVLMDHQRGYHELDVKAKLTTPEILDEHGSWDAVDAWGTAGGRVYSTAINCLTLQTYRRYLRFQDDQKHD